MDKPPKELVKRLREVNAIIAKLNPAIRSSAFSLFEPYIAGAPIAKGSGAGRGDEPQDSATEDADEFFTKHATDNPKPADNAMLVAAHFYSQYGSQSFGSEQIKKIAD